MSKTNTLDDVLRSADPAAGLPGRLAGSEDVKHGILAEAMPVMGVKTPRRKRRWPSIVAGGLALFLGAGGYAAYAGSQFIAASAGTHFMCMTELNGGTDTHAVTGDPVIDCAQVFANQQIPHEPLVGLAQEGMLVALPRQVVEKEGTVAADGKSVTLPDGGFVSGTFAILSDEDRAVERRIVELDAFLTDGVDGLHSMGCIPASEAKELVEAKGRELGLEDVTVKIHFPFGQCTWGMRGHHNNQFHLRRAGSPWGSDEAFYKSLRDAFTTQCVAAGDAERVAQEALGDQLKRTELRVVSTGFGECSRVDAEASERNLVTVRTP